MARKKGGGRGLLLAGLAAGAYAYFKKPENREKATVAFNDVKAKVNEYMESQNLDHNKNQQDQKSEGLDKTDLQENKMTAEGGTQATVQYYNEKEQKEKKEDNDDVKLSSNDDSEEKSENTESVSSEPRLNTDKL
ncbi:hypothetical protein BBI15_14360 [Planococcus plakortidis]|uniref:Uncharacterized protein n=1 Tax=Planococcus plakortidis TaxID=1038856 RepID=A0A1C7EBB6_9BACL|nr:hypothetical protein [Planococcus plakortidis]ANU21284.1 hypothetical protein BBI15_14360 [Planococcus plakortidis]